MLGLINQQVPMTTMNFISNLSMSLGGVNFWQTNVDNINILNNVCPIDDHQAFGIKPPFDIKSI
jgi:hypothetical protein